MLKLFDVVLQAKADARRSALLSAISEIGDSVVDRILAPLLQKLNACEIHEGKRRGGAASQALQPEALARGGRDGSWDSGAAPPKPRGKALERKGGKSNSTPRGTQTSGAGIEDAATFGKGRRKKRPGCNGSWDSDAATPTPRGTAQERSRSKTLPSKCAPKGMQASGVGKTKGRGKKRRGEDGADATATGRKRQKTWWDIFRAQHMPMFVGENPTVKLNQFKIVSEWMSGRWNALSKEEQEGFKVLPKNEGDQDQTARARPDRSRSPRKASGTPAATGGADQSKAEDAAQPQQSSVLIAASVTKATEAVGEPQTDDSQATLGHPMESQAGA